MKFDMVAVIGVGVVLALWAKFTGDLKPLSIFVIGVAGAFLFFLVNFVFGKLNEQP